MDHLIESQTTKILWPFGSDKRMLFSIHAHFNTMLKKQHSLNLPGPVALKLRTLCSTLKSLLQILTGMTADQHHLDFELSSMFDALDIALKHASPLAPTFDINTVTQRSTRADTVPILQGDGQKQKKKRPRKRRKSQHAVIYDLNMRDHPKSDDSALSAHIIEDYQPDAVTMMKSRKSIKSLKSLRSIDSPSSIRLEAEPTRKSTNRLMATLPSSHCSKYTDSMWKAPIIGPLSHRNDRNQGVDPDSFPVDSLMTMDTFTTSCFAPSLSSISSMQSLSNSRTQCLRDNYNVEAIDSDIDSGLESFSLTAGCLNPSMPSKRELSANGIKRTRRHRQRRRSKAHILRER